MRRERGAGVIARGGFAHPGYPLGGCRCALARRARGPRDPRWRFEYPWRESMAGGGQAVTTSEAEIGRLRELLGASRRAVAFTGAGISTESGIPDFRSPGGIWAQYQPIDFSDFIASEEMRRESWRRKVATDETVRNAQPNAGHLALAELVRCGKVSSVITQNVDGLHQRSGVPEERVIELHGNATYAACLECGRRYELEPILEAFVNDDALQGSFHQVPEPLFRLGDHDFRLLSLRHVLQCPRTTDRLSGAIANKSTPRIDVAHLSTG